GTVTEAVVVRSDPVVGTANRTLSVWAEPNEPPRSPWLHGMFARLALVVEESDPTLAVPREAVLQEGTRTYLFVRQDDGRFERRLVETGRSDDRWVEVTRGLREGEPVAVQGVAELQTAYASLK